MPDTPPRFALLSIATVQALTSLSRPAIYKAIAAKTFPRQRQLAGRRVVWVAGEIEDWCKEQAGHETGTEGKDRAA